MEMEIIINLSYDLNNATSIQDIKLLEQKYYNIIHPYKSYMFGNAYMINNETTKSFEHFLHASRMGINNKTEYIDTLFSDSVGSSLAYILTSYTLKNIDIALKFNMFANAYVFISSTINLSGVNAYESYRNRAALLEKYEGQLTLVFLAKYLGLSTISEVLFLSDYFFASKGFKNVGILDDAQSCLENSINLHNLIQNIEVDGKTANSYALEEISNLGKRRHDILYNKSRLDFNNNVFEVDFDLVSLQ